MRQNTEYAYGSVARWLHWGLAFAILGLLAVGLYAMEFGGREDDFPWIPVHKATGLIVLLLLGYRLWWRLRSVQPELSDSMMVWQKQLAHAMHWLLYLCIFAMPISGWVMSSGSGRPVSFYGLFDIPALPVTKAMGNAAMSVHNNLWILLLICIGMHAFSALVHHFYYRDTVLKRMLP